ncbi:NucA/NucB deoxyribonuclease domain-containing protein [Streptomyces sp. 3211.6]|uniref:NucA/NucB deoxyribonuclease domain-containing protein n=1 Tax=Streptomyces sp. 3211.6 TaxID=1938845 RepID=UPI0011E5E230|nr:NucA/NucB deoxyribonuclease domain-containing protein [Streptomyces sp. 3211.6]
MTTVGPAASANGAADRPASPAPGPAAIPEAPSATVRPPDASTATLPHEEAPRASAQSGSPAAGAAEIPAGASGPVNILRTVPDPQLAGRQPLEFFPGTSIPKETSEQFADRKAVAEADAATARAATGSRSKALAGAGAASSTVPDLSVEECRKRPSAEFHRGLVVSHRFMCQVQRVEAKRMVCSTGECEEVGKYTFRVTTIGRVSYDTQGRVTFNILVDDWKQSGTPDPTAFLRIDVGCTAGPYSCGAEPTNGLDDTITNWQRNGLTFAAFNPPAFQSPPSAPEGEIADFPFYVRVSMPGYRGVGDVFADNEFRCDADPKVGGPKAGCVFQNVVEELIMDRNIGEYKYSAQHIWDAQYRPESTEPKVAGKKIPGSVQSGVPLTRLAPGDASAIKKNRGRSTRTCTRVFGANYAQYDPATNTHLYDCDEYPFASTQQGAQIPRGNTNFSVRALPEADNQAGGRVLGDFYRTQRIIKDDRFYVTITGPAIPPAPGAPAPLPGMETWGRCEQFDTPSGGEADVCGPILDKYKERGGPASLGYPLDNDVIAPDGTGRFQHFSNDASIYWSPDTGAHTVRKAIRDKWAELGWESGLGYPTTDESGTPDGVGAFNHFRRTDGWENSVYWTAGTGAHAVMGEIRKKWAALGWEQGLGYPTTDEAITPDGVGRFNHFRRLDGWENSVYWTAGTGAHAVMGEIRKKWAAYGWEQGLGYPTTDESAAPDGVGRYNHFTNDASIYWTPDTGAHTVRKAIRDKWAELGWESGLGYPTTDESGTPDGVGAFNHFRRLDGWENSVYWTAGTGAHAVMGEIRKKWAAYGWEQGLGYPTTDESAAPDGVGRYNHFTNDASIYWTPDTGAHTVRKAIRDKWAAYGWERGLGYPTTDESGTPDGVGAFNHFTNGASIYWSPDTGAHTVRMAIRDKWAELGWESGLGYPTTDESGTPDGGGAFNHFRRLDGWENSVYWSPSTGAHAVMGEIRKKWAALGWEGGLGYPTTDENTTPDGVGRYNHFRRTDGWENSVYWTPGTGAHEVLGEIRKRWASLGWERSWLGYPTSGEYAVSGGRRTDFQHGYAFWNAANNTVTTIAY